MKSSTRFPDGFLWGASTSAHQVEGKNYNQWTVWELEHAKHLAVTAENRLGWMSNWPDIKQQAEDPENYLSGEAVRHFDRYEHDFDILQKLNCNSYRFSIEWSRIEPREGEWDVAAIAHYRKYIQALQKRGIEPVLTLWHWTLPVWFAERGGFEKGKNVQYFERFVKKVCKELPLGELSYVITLNEPTVYAAASYGSGEWPPSKKSPFAALKVMLNLVSAHRAAYRVLKESYPKLQAASANAIVDVRSKSDANLLDRLTARVFDYGWNRWFLNRTKERQDFVGLNYYMAQECRFSDIRAVWEGGLTATNLNTGGPHSDVGWRMEPKALARVLGMLHDRYAKPIFITENGLADGKDEYREWWIDETYVAMQEALRKGVPLVGYLHWSLLDNFEWSLGWWPRFGLVAVDRTTMKRRVRSSARLYARTIARASK